MAIQKYSINQHLIETLLINHTFEYFGFLAEHREIMAANLKDYYCTL